MVRTNKGYVVNLSAAKTYDSKWVFWGFYPIEWDVSPSLGPCSVYLGQRGVPDHQSFGFLESRITLCDHIHRLLPDKFQGVQPTRYHSFTLR